MDALGEGFSAEEIIRLLELSPHPEGGYFRETFRDDGDASGRALSTAIYFLLTTDRPSRWHRVDATEIWHHYAGAPIRLTLSGDGQRASQVMLGTDLGAGERPQVLVPKDCWQTAETTGVWTLVGCTVAPGFEFSGFEMAPPGFNPEPSGA